MRYDEVGGEKPIKSMRYVRSRRSLASAADSRRRSCLLSFAVFGISSESMSWVVLLTSATTVEEITLHKCYPRGKSVLRLSILNLVAEIKPPFRVSPL